mgnify:CR=1 FL=1
MRILLSVLYCACWSVSSALTFTNQTDSIGTETINGVTFILHRVTDKETLYSLSRKYDVPIYKIIEHNPSTEYGLEEGEIIKVPRFVKSTNTHQSSNNNLFLERPTQTIQVEEQLTEKVIAQASMPLTEEKEVIHKVKQKETLFSISRQYNVTVADIKTWNDLPSNALEIGQKLVIRVQSMDKEKPEVVLTGKVHVVEPSETLYSISKKFDISIQQIKDWNQLTTNELSIGQALRLEAPTVELVSNENSSVENHKIVSADTIMLKEALDTARYHVIESGLAELIDGSSNNRKYLALHKTAKTGTLMRVKNEMNNQEIFVRVIGPLPDTSDNKNVVIKISKAAYDRLGAIDPKFRVKVSLRMILLSSLIIILKKRI